MRPTPETRPMRAQMSWMAVIRGKVAPAGHRIRRDPARIVVGGPRDQSRPEHAEVPDERIVTMLSWLAGAPMPATSQALADLRQPGVTLRATRHATPVVVPGCRIGAMRGHSKRRAKR